ncbi:hypothetical protein CAI16_05225 [Virgibacillus dokdonensis]|uniref:Bro-N domain-containing protein n=1 Tax=Virgibacillus dokdonensis TaxID=302167 RepID=A0A3E0WW18_9BACI|nr:phage antirepressor KilAC domain-containing protein [Virgibacillus dokdonensis]RFA36195.1 hypothetical protein CAI16_05225 [Virgibacillus dokdonensis]
MEELKVFNHEQFGELPIVVTGGKEYFGANEVGKALEYAKPHKAISDHCDPKGVLTWGVPTNGGKQNKKFITVGNISRLIVAASKQSRNKQIRDKAKKYEKWIFDEVIPSIHKHGAYMTPQKIEEALMNPDTIIQLATTLKQEQAKVQELEQENNELKPKASYHDLVLQSKTLITVTQIAKDYGMGAPTLNKKLHELGVQYKRGERWYLYHKYQDKGYAQSKTYVVDSEKSKDTMCWTQKGRLFIYQLLKEQGILPLIEREETA